MARRPTRRGRTSAKVEDDVPDVYRGLIAEVDSAGSALPPERPLKRRKVLPRVEPAQRALPQSNPASSPNVDRARESSPRIFHIERQQTVEDSSESDGSDFEFEDVDFGANEDSSPDLEDSIEDVSVSVAPESTPSRQSRGQKSISAVDKAHRILVHKFHILCLLGHCMYVNGRCSNPKAQERLRPLLQQRTISFLNADSTKSQYQRNSMFMDGLQQAVQAFSGHFRVTATGLRKPLWSSGEQNVDISTLAGPIDRDDFVAAAESLKGSQDLGNQLFCALLRSVGVRARIVFSMQVLPITNATATTPAQSDHKNTIHATVPSVPSDQRSTVKMYENDASIASSKRLDGVPPVRRRLGQPGFSTNLPVSTPPKRAPKIQQLAFPVFWVEAFNAAHQKWIPIDPVVTHTVGKPAKIEPPASYQPVQLHYAIAFEDDGSARDVTRRYARAYNAKTRRHRVEATGPEGVQWWNRTMRVFRRARALDYDQVEDAEMAQKEAAEGLPSNVLDFSGHPYYALERHLKRNEVIHPKREVGKVNAGSSKHPRMETVYRRRDVLTCKSADKWYRSGRNIKEGEQPLKYVAARARRAQTPNLDDDAGGQAATIGLYAHSQTDLYVPPPIERGRVPKNAYGNLDVYVPTMIPRGGVHIRDNLAAQAARLLRVDYADAVTGFQFKGRHGTAVIEGIVVAETFGPAIEAVITGFRDDILEDESKARSLQALRLWKRFLTGLRIAERVRTYGDIGEEDVVEPTTDVESGGFFPGEADEDEAMPTAGRFSSNELSRLAKRASTQRKSARYTESDEDAMLSPEHASVQELREEKGSLGLHQDDPALDQYQNVEGDNAGGFFVEDQVTDNDYTTVPLPDVDALPLDEGGGFIPDDNVSERSDGPGHDEDALSPTDENAAHSEQAGRHCDVSDSIAHADGTEPKEATLVPKLDSILREARVGPLEEHDGTTAMGSKPQNDSVDVGNEASYEIPRIVPESEHSPEPKSVGMPDDRPATSDDGSVLSHDPDDEDAERDWVESD